MTTTVTQLCGCGLCMEEAKHSFLAVAFEPQENPERRLLACPEDMAKIRVLASARGIDEKALDVRDMVPEVRK